MHILIFFVPWPTSMWICSSPYSLNCHWDAMVYGSISWALQNSTLQERTELSQYQWWVTHNVSSEFHRVGPETAKLLCPISSFWSEVLRGHLALLHSKQRRQCRQWFADLNEVAWCLKHLQTSTHNLYSILYWCLNHIFIIRGPIFKKSSDKLRKNLG